MRIGRSLLLLAAAASAATAAAAQQPPAEPDVAPANSPDIFVEGRQREAISAFVAALANPSKTNQYARWEADPCPIVAGLDPHQADFVSQRISAVAQPLHLTEGIGRCPPSALVIVTPDASATAAALARALPVTLRTDGQGKLDRFVASKRAIRWLSVTDPCGFGGCSLPGSRLKMSERPRFSAMIAIVDAQAIGGFSLGEIADYVAFVLLANPAPGGPWPASSILSMFDRDRAPGGRFALTDSDHAFLDGLYRTRPDAPSTSQRASIANRMIRKGR
jgi:hypothetical protein